MAKKSLFDLTGKIAVVTGAGANGGIGYAIALGLAEHGADLVVSDVDDEGVKRTGAAIKALGSKVVVEHCDISQPDQVEALFAAVDSGFARIDVLVNVPYAHPARVQPHELELHHWNEVLAVGLTGYHLCSQQAVRRMLAQESGGSIINIGSSAGVSGLGRGNYAYSCAKGGVSQMTREMAVEYAGRNIRVNAILPAQVLTPGVKRVLLDDPRFKENIMPNILRGIPLGRMLDPDDFKGPAVFLASSAAAAVTGVLFPVDGGNLAMNATGSHTWPDGEGEQE